MLPFQQNIGSELKDVNSDENKETCRRTENYFGPYLEICTVYY